MLQIIFILAGIIILVKGKINFSKKRVLMKPNSMYIGIALIIDALLISYLGVIAYGLFFVIIIAAFFLSQKTEISTSTVK